MKRAIISQMYLAVPFVLALSACSGRSDGTGATDSAHTTLDALKSKATSMELRGTDSVYLAEPSALSVTRNSVFVADAGSSSVLVFGRDGKLQYVVGRRGKGPGEFVAPIAMTTINDSLLAVSDAALRRVSMYRLEDHKYLSSVLVPGMPFSISAAHDTILLGIQDVARKTSVARFILGDAAVQQLGPIPAFILQNAQVASSYPFSLASASVSGYRVGFTASNLIYGISTNGDITDSVSVPVRNRRGVPVDLPARLAKSTSPQNEAASTSLLVTMAGLSGGRTGLIHMDYIVTGSLVTGQAYLSTISAGGAAECADIKVPLLADTRPMFAFFSDTLFIVQNSLNKGSTGATATLSSIPVPRCS